MNEKDFGHGGLKRPYDIRDFKVHKLVGKAPVPFDWNSAPQLLDVISKQTTPTKNQGSSSSCGGQSTAYYNGAILNNEESARWIYSQVAVQGGGCNLRDAFKTVVQRGYTLESEVPSTQGGQCTESFMLSQRVWAPRPDRVNPQGGYAFCKTDIDSVACAIRDNGGCVILLQGQDNGSWLSINPQPPFSGDTWAHFLYCVSAGMYNGKKAILCHNSWGTQAGQNGYQILTEDYFNSGRIKECGVLYSTSVYSHSPNVLQKWNWLAKFLNWFLNYSIFLNF